MHGLPESVTPGMSRARSSLVRLASKIAGVLLAGDITGLIGMVRTTLEAPGTDPKTRP